jgi:ATP-dependent Clp protease, protease subunit
VTRDAGLSVDAKAAEGVPSFGDEHVFQRLLRERIVFLGREVDDDIANRISAEMLLLSAQDARRDIHLYVNSPGGSVTAGMAIYDVMQYVPNDIVTVTLGFAGSMAQVLACAGTPGKRYALPNARIMMHQPSGGIGGAASDIKIQADQMRFVKKVLAERIAHHAGHTPDEIFRDWDRDRWFTAAEAKDYGLIDEVVGTAAQIPAAPVS